MNFFVNTDHKPLTYVMNSTTERSSLRQTRHLAYIAEFTTDIRYVKGKTNFVADALTRHPSHRATKPFINSRFVWHGMNIDIANWCRSCTGCQTAKVSRHNKPVFGKFDEPTGRFDHVHVHLVGPLPYSDGFKYLLTCVDPLTRWPESIPLVDISAETVADAFFSGWVAHFGTPATITTARGAQFESSLWDTLSINLVSLETVHRVTTPSRMAWSNVSIASLKLLLWHTNHQTRGQLDYRQSYSASDRPSRKR